MLTIALAGSRHLQSPAIVAPVVRAALAAGHQLRVGCCVGADALVIQAALAAGGAQQLHVHGIGALGGVGRAQWAQGWCSLSAVSAVRAAQGAGAHVHGWCGGSAPIPLAARLIRRSQAVIAGASALILFAPGAGSLAVAALAVTRGMPVFAFGPLPAPVPGSAGAWAPSSLFGLPCWAWQLAQASLL